MGGKNTPSEGPKKGHFGGQGVGRSSIEGLGPSIWGLGGPFSTILDLVFGTTLRGPPLNAKQSPRYGIWRALDPLKRVDFGSFLGHFWPFSMRPLEGALPSSDWNMDVSGPRPEKRQKIGNFSSFFEQFLRLVGKEGERGWFLFRFQTLWGSKICSPK